ncbi:hypothetical protein NQ317_017645 [Molorchus minor]|uniref:Uncharacterized protein n=1 Tax=Molorchus minor TaxID=1323400 RepID=A0ABQ9JM05_9CUCU|nr:hypothetical protein NQ317_017645 [Molorchus minor]
MHPCISDSLDVRYETNEQFGLLPFLNQERERKVITLKEEGNSNLWSYFTHCAALCVLLSIGIATAPLIHDYTVMYKGSLDDITLVCIIGSILHLSSGSLSGCS